MSFFTFLEEKITEILFQLFFLALVAFLLIFYGVDMLFVVLLVILFISIQGLFQWCLYRKKRNASQHIIDAMENKKKMKQLHAVLLITGIPLNIIQWVSIILWITTGIQWLFWGYILVAIPYAIFIIRFLSKRIVYICPQCHEIFKPHLKEFIFSNHSMTLRKLTCTSCGYHGFCVETYREEEKNNE